MISNMYDIQGVSDKSRIHLIVSPSLTQYFVLAMLCEFYTTIQCSSLLQSWFLILTKSVRNSENTDKYASL